MRSHDNPESIQWKHKADDYLDHSRPADSWPTIGGRRSSIHDWFLDQDTTYVIYAVVLRSLTQSGKNQLRRSDNSAGKPAALPRWAERWAL